MLSYIHVITIRCFLFSAGTLQRRWKNLRDCYTRELLRLMKVKASGNVDRKRGYIYFKQLSFLRKVVKPTKRSTDIPPNELEVLKSVLDSDEIPVQSEDPLEEMETSTSVKTFEEEFQESSNTYVHLLSANGEEENIMTVSEAKNSSNGQTKKASSRNSRLTKPTNAPEDCDTLFLMSLVRDLQEIPDEQKLEVKIELMQVLKRARLKALKGKESYCNSQQTKQQRLTIKDEADSESLEDIDEHSLDSIKDPTTPELLEEDNL